MPLSRSSLCQGTFVPPPRTRAPSGLAPICFRLSALRKRLSPVTLNGAALKLPSEVEPIFRDTAHTVLPMEYKGRAITMEAHAYEDDSASYQAMALVYRKPGATGRSVRARP